MGGSGFFFIESKTFEFRVEEGGMFYQLRIYERARDSLRSIFMGKGSAKRLLFNVEELIAGQSRGQFAKSFHEGDKCFILQLGSNTYGSFLLISELIHGRRKGSIVVPEGKSGEWLERFWFTPEMPQNPKPQASKQPQVFPKEMPQNPLSLVVGKWKNSSGGGDEGKNKTALVQNSNPRDFRCNNRDTCKESILRQREQLWAKILSTINGIESNGIKSKLTLDLYMRMERGKDGRWAIVWSEVNGGPKSGATYKTHCS